MSGEITVPELRSRSEIPDLKIIKLFQIVFEKQKELHPSVLSHAGKHGIGSPVKISYPPGTAGPDPGEFSSPPPARPVLAQPGQLLAGLKHGREKNWRVGHRR